MKKRGPWGVVALAVAGIALALYGCAPPAPTSLSEDDNTSAGEDENGGSAKKKKDGGSGSSSADAGSATPRDAATCDLSADFAERITDASIADGQSSTGFCLGCVVAKCTETIDTCDQTCECKAAMATALDCYAKTGSTTTCGARISDAGAAPKDLATKLFTCVNTSCQEECQITPPRPARDGG